MKQRQGVLRKLRGLLRREEPHRGVERDRDLFDAMHREGCELAALPDRELRSRWSGVADRIRSDDSTDRHEIPAFAIVREVARRTLGQRPHDVQVRAAIELARGRIVEMQTGEGKTLAAVLPAALLAATGRGVHVLTCNDYLARRDAGWMGPVYRRLGLDVAFVVEGMSPTERRRSYAADVTYVTAKEAGFDYLRDATVTCPSDAVHRAFHAAIVDEADSLLIDEARVPLVLAGATDRRGEACARMATFARGMRRGIEYVLDDHGRNLEWTDRGLDCIASSFSCGDPVAPSNAGLLAEVHRALHAEVLLQRDVDYLVRDGRIELIDEATGRVVVDRHWPDGLQAALEAKEGVGKRPEGRVLGTLTVQHLVRLYPRLCGMTGTATPAAEELRRYYGLEVEPVPTHRPCVREDLPDRIFGDRASRDRAVIEEVRETHASGRPVLVGTTSVAESERLAHDLRVEGVACRVLNARSDELEAAIVAEAGDLGAVTLSTNMAGRGTDIRLGGVDGVREEQVVRLGGLHVLGVGLRESERVVGQLRGRAGRQGDPGSSRFLVSLEDPLAATFGESGPDGSGWPPGELSGDRSAVSEIRRVRRVARSWSAECRETLYRYASVVEEQRQVVHRRRRELLSGRSPFPTLADSMPSLYREVVRQVEPSIVAREEQRLALLHLDRCWGEHLEALAELREGVHLSRLGGRDPSVEFRLRASEAFSRLEPSIEAGVASSLRDAEWGPEGIDLAACGLQRPSSTWTYAVNDDPFRDQLGVQLLGPGNFGVAAGAALLTTAGPLLIAWGLYNRFRRRRSA